MSCLTACKNSPEQVVDLFIQAANNNNASKALSYFDQDSRQLLREVAIFELQKSPDADKIDPLKTLFSSFKVRAVEEIRVVGKSAEEVRVAVYSLNSEVQIFVLHDENGDWKMHLEFQN